MNALVLWIVWGAVMFAGGMHIGLLVAAHAWTRRLAATEWLFEDKIAALAADVQRARSEASAYSKGLRGLTSHMASASVRFESDADRVLVREAYDLWCANPYDEVMPIPRGNDAHLH